MNSMSHEYHRDIVAFSIKVKNYVAAVRALRREEYLQGVNVANIVLSKLPTVLLSKWADYSYPLIITGGKSRMDILSDFLSDEAVKISTCSANLLNTKTDNKRKYYSENNYNQSHTVLLQTSQSTLNSDDKCRFCRASKHKLPECKKFKKSLRKDRWAYVKRAGICYKCLVSHHDRQTCLAAACDVDSCGEPHHRLLHYVPSSRQNGAAVVQVIDTKNNNISETSSQTNVQSDIVTHITSDNCAVLLQVVKINIHGPNGVISATALLDSGSTVTLISATLAARLALRGRKQILHARGAWGDTGLMCETELVDVTISNKQGTMYTICARSVTELNLPSQNLNNVNYEKHNYLRDLRDELCTGQLKPEILIGQDNYHLMLPLETVTGSPTEPYATRTPLGWCLHGKLMKSSTSPVDHHSTLFITDDGSAPENLNDLHEEVRRSFSIESMGISASKPRQNSEDQRAWEHLEKTSTFVDGKWYVGLPWKDTNSVMPDTYSHALSRLKGVELKMKRSTEYAEKYKERIHYLLENNYAEELKDPEVTPKTWYLPHFGLENPNKKKLRVIFDAASKVAGLSLND
ncbi:uncharacterized protein [Epargyreus clarus]|uniref:uncharacterized protein n=1 Tax=Epargyreus clarus TaxID=520877 RepID=UPI003C2D8049